MIPALLMSSAAFANVADLNYQVSQGKFHLSAQADYSKGGFDYVSGGSTTEFDTKTSTLEAVMNYGLTNDFSLGLKLGYDLISDLEMTGYHSKENGMKDPEINASYRLMNKDDMALDLNLGALISLGDKDDNAYRGGHSLSIGADLSKKWGKFELMGDLRLNYLFESKEKDNSDDTTTTYDPSYDLEMTLAGQYAVTNEFYLNARAGYSLVGEVDSEYGSPVTKSNEESYGNIALGLGAKYAFNADAALKLGVDMNMPSDHESKDEGAAADEYKSYKVTTAYLGVDLSF